MGTTRLTMKMKLVNSGFVARILPATAGTLFLSLNPCMANGGHSGMPAGLWTHTNNSGHNFVHAFTPITPPHNLSISSPTSTSGLTGSGFNLDLSSATSNIVLGSKMFGPAGSATINVGGSSQTFHAGQSVTAAEFVAIQQVLSHSSQAIVINSQGEASGGSFSLNQADSKRVSEILIPQGVTALDYFSSNRVLSIGGDLINYGSIYGVSTSSSVRSGTIAALEITNEVGGKITTQSIDASPAANTAGVSLNLTAQNDLTNHGTISSGGTLTLASKDGGINNTAGFTIVHLGPPGSMTPDFIIKGPAPQVTAQGDVNLLVGNGNLNNDGSIISRQGSINIFAPHNKDINIEATGGLFKALNGDINVRDPFYNSSADINMNGGDYLSNNLNLYGGQGSITGSVGRVSGTLNTTGDAAHFFANTPTLTLGSNCLKGDPTFANAGGNIVINGAIVAAEDITILASGNITASGNAYISTANATSLAGAGGAPTTNVTLIAGAAIVNSGATSTTIPGLGIGTGNTATVNLSVGATGGNIDLSKSTHVGPIIDTSSTLQGAGNDQINGGNVVLAAVSTVSNPTSGVILFPTKNPSIDTSSVFGNGGNVQIFAGNAAAKASSPSISINNIKTQTDPAQGLGADGNVTIISALPVTTNGKALVFDSTGAVTSANSIKAGAPSAGSIVLTGGISAGGGVVVITTAGGAGTLSGITQTGTGRIENGDITLSAGILGIGTKSASILTNTLGPATLNSGSNVFVNNLGSILIIAGSGGLDGTFQVVTTADNQGNGSIVLQNLADIAVQGTKSLINLNSTELVGGNGGIFSSGFGGNLVAATVTLTDGIKGAGTGNIANGASPITIAGTAFSPIPNLSANTRGNVNLNPQGSVTLLSSSAGNGQQFQLTTTPVVVGGNQSGTITLNGKIASTFGRIGNISLDSGENGTGTGGLVFKSGSITADTVNLSDSNFTAGPFTGTGNASIGSAKTAVSVFAGTLGINTNGALVNVKDTNTAGVFLQSAFGGGNATAGNLFTLTSAGGIATSGVVTNTNNSVISLLAGGAGYIIVQGAIDTTNGGLVSGGTVNLTTSGTGFISQTGGSDTIATTVNLTAKNGYCGSDINPFLIHATNLNSKVVGFTDIYNNNGAGPTLNLLSTTAKSQFTLESDSAIIVNLTASKTNLTSATGIKIATTTNGSSNQSITYDNSLGGTKTSTVELDAQGTGTINGSSAAVILTASNLVKVSSGGGNIGNLFALQVSAPNMSFNTIGATGTVTANEIAKTTNLLNSASDAKFTLTGTGSVTLTDLQSVNGSISVSTSGALLQTAPNAVIAVGDTVGPTPAATGSTLTLQNTNMKTGSIFIGAGSNILTNVTGPGAGSGTITIEMGTPGAPQNNIGPASIKVTNTGTGSTFFGKNGIVGIGAANSSFVNSINTNTVFDTNGLAAKTITVDTGVTITADPTIPAIGSATGQMLMASSPSTIFTAPAAAPTAFANTSYSAGLQSVPANSASSTFSQFASQSPTLASSNQSSALSSIALASLPGLSASLAGNQYSWIQASSQYASQSSSLNRAWISDTELSNGEIPALIASGEELGIVPDQPTVVDMQTGAGRSLKTAERAVNNVSDLDNTRPLVGSVTKTVAACEKEKTQAISLNNGSVVFAPSSDTIVSTPMGRINIAAKSVVLVMAFGKGVAVYDLHDNHSGAVQITCRDKTLTLMPGQHVLITDDSVKDFAEINPAQMIGFQDITDQRLGCGLKAFKAEFSIPHAIQAVQPLKHLLASRNPQAQRIANRLLKTTAVLMQLRGQKPYRQVFRQEKIALAQ